MLKTSLDNRPGRKLYSDYAMIFGMLFRSMEYLSSRSDRGSMGSGARAGILPALPKKEFDGEQ